MPPAHRHGLGRWQFSLRGLLLFVLLASMAMSLFVTARRLLRVEATLADYRREYGILDVEEESDKTPGRRPLDAGGVVPMAMARVFPAGEI